MDRAITCARCLADLRTTTSIVSKFNTDWICRDCKTREVAHPKYAEANRAEMEAVRRGDMNYPGIGVPAKLYRPPCKAEEFVVTARLLTRDDPEPVSVSLPESANRYAFPDGSRAAVLPTGAICVLAYA